MRVAKTKALISFAIIAMLICVFVFAYAKSRFSHDTARIGSSLFAYMTFLLKLNKHDKGNPTLVRNK